ncbi:hypothetical protein AB8E26_05635 [Stenotrophomonas rhizophila]
MQEIDPAIRQQWAAATFSDYVNYLLVIDILLNVSCLAAEQASDSVLSSEIAVDWGTDAQQRFVGATVASEQWFGYLDGCGTVDELLQRCKARIGAYRRYFNYSGALPPSIEQSKTEIGQPAAVVADALRLAGVIPQNSLIFLRIDQHEELYALEKLSGYGEVFRKVINRALSMRDSRIAYRIGTRHYAWNDRVEVWGSSATVENLRDYVALDIDEYFRRPESKSAGWKFPSFAEDVFRRRLNVAGYDLSDIHPGKTLDHVFGETLLPSERARRYARTSDAKLRLEPGWAQGWGDLLHELWRKDPMSARLGEAYLRQREQVRRAVATTAPQGEGLPWEAPEKVWWRKERLEVAAMQIASDCNQSMIWSGSRHIVELAGGNILPFMTICGTIWAAWLRNSDCRLDQEGEPPQIDVADQTVGVLEASKIWFDKLQEGIYGDRRKRLVSNLGAWFSVKLKSDRAISYPGHNGFSLSLAEIDGEGEICELIKECRDQGDLLQSDHTSKLSDSRPRIKWYLNPILSPFFRIPQSRTKEPIYSTLHELQSVYDQVPKISPPSEDSVAQGELF